MRAVPGVPGVPSAEELSALPHAGLARLLSEAYRVCAEPLCGRSYVVGPVPLAEREFEFALPGAGCGEALYGVA